MVRVGAYYIGNSRCRFTVWAPEKTKMILHLVAPAEQRLEMQPGNNGYFSLDVDHVPPGTRYFFQPDGQQDYPDPASHYQPEGVHNPSEVVDHQAYSWQDQSWRGLPFKDLILYEIHVGTFTPEGTFEAIIPRLPDLVETGINALELMPITQFPGNRNWGYDGVYPYAVQDSYGGPQGLKKLVDACHAQGIAVWLDVVYNHLGPEGNYFSNFGPYFTTQYRTPWGDALNFDQEWSDGVREFFANNTVHWFDTYHIDGLRLDAIHTIFDSSAVHFWELTYTRIRQLEQKLGRSLYMVAESDLNNPIVVKSPDVGGYGFDAQWLDDFHHALYVLLDKNGRKRYQDFGRMEQLAKAYTDGFVHSGEYVTFRKRRYGASSAGIPGNRFIVFNLNHDQVGNRIKGERLSHLVDFDRLKLAAAAVMLSPYVPMLFMGEEYADDAPFFYFVSHSEDDLIRMVQEGRKKDFAAFGFDTEPLDPQADKTFTDSVLRWQTRKEGKHGILLNWHKTLIALRRSHPVLQHVSKNDIRVDVIGQQGFVLHRQNSDGNRHISCLFNLSEDDITYVFPAWGGQWSKLLDSKEPSWSQTTDSSPTPFPATIAPGNGQTIVALSVAVYEMWG